MTRGVAGARRRLFAHADFDDEALVVPLPGNKEIISFGQAQGANFHCQPTGAG
jgi:hypothetical protein